MTNIPSSPAFIHDVFDCCYRYPDRISVINTDGLCHTYADFLDMIERTSGYLKAVKIPAGSFIVVNLPNCMEYLAIEYGAWMCGCAVVPVTPLYPEARIRYMVEHCDAALLIDEGVLEEIRKADRLCVRELNEDGIAAIYYTSGSTGTPKGVIHTFETLGRADRFSEIFEVTPDDCFGMGAPFSFIAWILTVPFLRAGASIRLIDRKTMTDVRLLQNFYDTEKVTASFISPSVLKQISLTGCDSLRIVFTGTERVSGVCPQTSSYKIFNLYGMTELTPIACCFQVKEKYHNTPVGTPFSDLEMKLAEDGEICFRGPVSPGYYKNPAASSALWRDGWLHTGDIGRFLPDGNLEYVNRKDWMVKINGQRVETGEISQVINEISGVSNSVAKGFTAEDGHQYIAAYYVADASVDDAAVLKYISGKLAPYMIPSYFVKMDRLPLNDNGKIDVKSLRSPADLTKARERVVTPPENDLQKTLCSAFETALGLSPIGIDDDFLSLGGDSIRVMRLQVLCEGIDLSADTVYRFKTPRLISEALSASSSATADSVKGREDYPLSQSQTGIYVECMNRRGEIAYNNPYLYKLSSKIDLPRFAEACEDAVKAHPGLFAVIFTGADGFPRQKAGDSSDFTLEVENLTEKEFGKLRHSLVRPFDILSDRLFRIRLFKTEKAAWLFVDFHHIVFDGTSNGVLVDDIEKAYSGGNVEFEPFSGFDLAADEEARRSSPFLQECRDWYVSTFSEVDRVSLPAPDIFSDNVSYGKTDSILDISSVTFARAAEKFGVTENVLSLAAFGYALGACTNSKSAAFATIYNGRKELRCGKTVGMMVKTLPVYCKWNESLTAGEYLLGVKDQLMGSMAHDLFSFAELCGATAFDSSVMFTFQDELLVREKLCGHPCSMISLLENATGEPLAVQLYKKGGRLAVRVEYRSNMFSKGYIDAFTECFVTVLRSLMESEPSGRTAELKLVDSARASELIRIGTGRKLDFDKSETFVKLFKKQVAARPDAVAVVDELCRTTYAELDRLSDILAAKLLECGVNVEDFVAVMMPRRREFPVSFIACFKCGAAYVPMDYEYPIDRLQYMLDDFCAKVLLTTRSVYEDKVKEGELKAGNIIFVDEISGSGGIAAVPDRSSPEGLAYMIYTSGTTGRPKGVMIEHGSLSNLIHWYSEMGEIGIGSRISEHASFSFDGSIPDLMTPLCFGGELHIIPSALRKDLSGLYRYFCDNDIDGTMLTTQLGMTMLRMYDLKLKFIVLGGEKLSGRYDTDVRLFNGYGPTEFTVASSYFHVDPRNAPDNIPIGKAVPNTLSAVVDPFGRLLPRGIPGELVLVGCQLARGYWHREDITAERFAPCTFIPGEKMYHTGDLVKWNADGDLLFMGRIDSQVKLRGFRIELGEIESVMGKFEGVKTPVAAVKEIGGMQHLCAYYCSDAALDENALRAFMAASLTDYMVPTAFIRMDAMPMTPNGKVDLKKLPVPEIRADEIVEPSTDLEQKLFDIVSEFLGNNAFGVTTNLISMGMTSLGAITLSLKIEKELGLKLLSSKMLERPSVREWAGMLGDSSDKADENPDTYPVQADYPLTDNQVGVYIDWEQHRDSTQYNVPLVLHFKNVGASQLSDAVVKFIQAHPYLKTRLKTTEGQVRQVRHDEDTVQVNATVLKTAPDKSFFQTMVKPFNLEGGELYRFEVFSFENDCWLFADVHHIIFDGGSESIFFTDILNVLNGREISCEEFSAYDYSLYYDGWKKSDAFDAAGEYFESLLEKKTSVQVPSSGSDGTGVSAIRLTVEREPVRLASRNSGVTENAFFLTAITQVLHKFTREDGLAILTVSNGRSLSALERTAGMFVQTVPVVSQRKSASVRETLNIMHRQIVETVSRDKYPFTSIVEKTGLKANFIVAYQGDVLDSDISVGGSPVEMIPLDSDTAKMAVSVNITPGKDVTELAFEYDRSAFTAEDVFLFAGAVKAYAENLATAEPDSDCGSVSCVSVEELPGLLELSTGPSMELDRSLTVVKMMHRFALSAPDSPAVVDSDGSISYSELDRMSDVLAAEILSKGVEPESFIALMLPRNRFYPVSFMATFKSGCAYVPMDYEYPADRLQYMIEDSRAGVLLTTHAIYDGKAREAGLNVPGTIFLDDFDFSSASCPVDLSEPSHLAYMIYTSGTTGRPKGVMIEHHSIVNMVSWNAELENVVPGTQEAEHASFSFDASVMDLMTSLSQGATLHILPEEMRKEPDAIFKYLNDNAIEVLTISTQLGMMLMGSYDLKLRSIMLGGEKLTGRYDNGVKLINGYGPTEFTICSSYFVVDPKNTPENIPIGKPVPNSVSAIVDPNGNLLPRGVAGELVLVGEQIARGYWNREDVTAQRFTPCPFIPGKKMYHTGDLACWNEDGDLMFMGRIDTQVKLRGFRIELGEIESVMSTYPGVASAVALVKEIGGVQHLCAWYTASADLDEAGLKSLLSSKLTSYMVPDTLMKVDKMPLTPNGKVDTKSLPLPQIAEKASDVYEAPEGEVETRIAEAFASALSSTSQLSRNASFFLMGGTSLLVMKAIVKLADAGLKVTYGDVFKYPTPRTLAAFLDGVETGSASAAPQLASAPSEGEKKRLPVVGEDGFDYSEINKLLSTNNVGCIDGIGKLSVNPVGDVLLLGSTGFLGIHILNELIHNNSGKIYCVVRPRKVVSCEGRLKSYLMYYFGNTFNDLFGKRIIVIEGDMTDDAVMEKLLSVKVDTVINCAANVKHFAAGDEIGKINLDGTLRLISYCLKSGARLIQTSTHSVSGLTMDGEPHVMLESDLYYGQELMTKYQQSKFAAERAILDAVALKGLKAKIMRLGNLMPRYSDGEFQINIENNGFMARMRAYYLIGCIASSHLHNPLEFAPIDETASAILSLATTPDKFTVFHPYNNHTIYIDDVVAIMRKCGLNIDTVDDAEFSARLQECLENERLNPYITTLVAYGSHNNYVENPPAQDFTITVLNDMDWRWSMTGERYLRDAIDKMIALEYFDKGKDE